MAEGEFEEQRIFKDGREYMITASKNQFHIQDLGDENKQLTLKFDENDLAWDAVTPSGEFRLAEMNVDGSLAGVFGPDGNSLALK